MDESSTNTAYRLLAVFGKAREIGKSVDGSTKGFKVWGEVLEVQITNRSDFVGATRLQRQLMLIDEELERLYIELQRRGIPETVYEEFFEHCQELINPLCLLQRWDKHYAPHLRGTVRSLLRQWGHTLGEQEKPIPPEQIKEVLQKLALFEEDVLEDESLDPSLRAFLLEQISIIERVLFDYKIIGARAFRVGLNEFIQEHFSQYENLKDDIEDEGPRWGKVKQALSFWKKIAEFYSHAETTVRALGASPEVIESAGRLLEQTFNT